MRTSKGVRVVVVMAMALGLVSALATSGLAAECTITLTNGDDNFSEFGGDDQVVCALAGNDTVYMGGGNDTVKGNLGNDELSGGEGNDHVTGNRGDDKVIGRLGDDVLDGNAGNDTIVANDQSGTDTVDGGEGFDRCLVDANDIIVDCEDITLT